MLGVNPKHNCNRRTEGGDSTFKMNTQIVVADRPVRCPSTKAVGLTTYTTVGFNGEAQWRLVDLFGEAFRLEV